MIKKNIVYFPTMPELLWKNTLAKELLRARNDKLFIDGFNKDEIECLLTFICTD